MYSVNFQNVNNEDSYLRNVDEDHLPKPAGTAIVRSNLGRPVF